MRIAATLILATMLVFGVGCSSEQVQRAEQILGVAEQRSADAAAAFKAAHEAYEQAVADGGEIRGLAEALVRAHDEAKFWEERVAAARQSVADAKDADGSIGIDGAGAIATTIAPFLPPPVREILLALGVIGPILAGQQAHSKAKNAKALRQTVAAVEDSKGHDIGTLMRELSEHQDEGSKLLVEKIRKRGA
jgi:hypothetical protein